MLAFSSGILGGHLLMQFAQTIQNLMVGRLLGTQALGRLTVSQTLVLLPFSRVAAPIQEVLFPTFSRMQDEPRRILNAWNRVNQVTAAIALPALFGLAVLAPEFTAVVLGDRWQGTEPVVRALAFSGIAIALQRLAMGVLSALAYYRSLVWIGLAAVVLTVLAVAIGSHWGLTVTAAALSIEALAIQTVVMTSAARSVGARLVDVLRPLGRIALAAVLMSAAVAAVAAPLRATDVPSVVTLVCGTFVGAVVYIPLLLRLETELITELVSFFRSRRARSQPVPARDPASAGAGERRL